MNNFFNYTPGGILYTFCHRFLHFSLTHSRKKVLRKPAIMLLLFFTSLSLSGQSYTAARQAFAAKNYNEALEKTEQALEASGDDTQLLMLAGNIHAALAVKNNFGEKHVRKATRYFGEVLLRTEENSNKHLDASFSLEGLWQKIMVQAAKYEQQAKYEEALQLLEKARIVLPEKVRTYLLAGKLAFGMKNYEVAEQNFNFLIDSLEYDGKQIQEVLNSLLTFSLVEDSLMEAGDVLKSAQRSQGDSIKAQMMKIELLISKGKMDYAEQWMDSVAIGKREKAQLFSRMGQQYQADDRLEKAAKYYGKALNADATLADARYLLAVTYQQMARDILDTATLKQLDEKQKQQASTHLDDAEEQLKKLQQLQPDYPLLNYTLKDVKETLARLS